MQQLVRLGSVHLALAMLAPAVGARAGAQSGAPNAAAFEQALDRRLQQLKPDGMSERNVRFEAVQAGRPSGGSYPFRATLTIRDYGPGYPANHFYGQTCIARMVEQTFTLAPNALGGWDVEGRMTPGTSERTCTPNPAAGVSSVPLTQVAGSPAQSGGTAPAPAPTAAPAAAAAGASAGAVAEGAYECWANGQARPLLNFIVRGGGRYVGADGTAGTYRLDPSTSRITFSGGALDGVMPDGFSAVYGAPRGRPTVSFRGRGGGEAAFCQKS
jgi:hypothetical protein